MHNHPVQRPVMVACQCCGVEQEFIFKSVSDHVICKGCVRHQGSTTAKAIQRDVDHVGLWRSELGIATEEHANEVAQLRRALEQRDHDLARQRTEINDLKAAVRTGVETAPPLAVSQWLADEAVTAAAEKRDAAYRSRDHAYRALWSIDRLHREDEDRNGHCVCGRHTSQCRELYAIAPVVDALIKWENG